MTDDGLRFCRDCRWLDRSVPLGDGSFCHHSKSFPSVEVDLVTGVRTQPPARLARVMRSGSVFFGCSPVGQYFEQVRAVDLVEAMPEVV